MRRWRSLQMFTAGLMGLIGIVFLSPSRALGQAMPSPGCDELPGYERLRSTLRTIVEQGKDRNSGLGNDRWAVVVNRDGIVCAVVFSGPTRSSQWPGSRVIAAQKANTANALSLPDFALSTANVYFPSLPGESLFSLATAAPPNPAAAYAGPPEKYGRPDDPMVGKPIGGVITFGGGLALYNDKGKIVGALGVSGDTSCADHVVAWKVRHLLDLDAVPAGVARNATDNMIFDIRDGRSPSGFGHPVCKTGISPAEIVPALVKTSPTGPGR